jgi:hypothetical protein
MKKTSIELLEAYFTLNCNNIHISKVIWENAKEMYKKEMIEFAWNCQEMYEYQIEEKFNEIYGDNNTTTTRIKRD